MASVTLSGIGKSFGANAVLQGVDLEVRDGEFLSLVGPSGCGKTTLLRIVAGLDHADCGQVRIGAQAVDALPPKQRDVAMVFQSYALYPYMTVAQNMALPLTMRRLSRGQRLPLLGRWWPGSAAERSRIAADVAAVAEPLGLGPLLGRRPAQLSGGQRQRVALGRAMVRQPQVFLMDEPLSNLDAKLRVDTRAEIAQLHRRLGATFVYVTHDQVEAMTMSDRVALMMDGRLLQVAPPQEIYDDPVHLRVAEFIGTPRINTLPAQPVEGGCVVGDRRWPLLVAGAGRLGLQLAVRPEWLQLADDPALAEPACVVAGRLVHLELLGAETLLHLRAEGVPQTLLARVDPARARHLSVGQCVALSSTRVLAFDGAGARLRDLQWLGGRRLQVVHG